MDDRKSMLQLAIEMVQKREQLNANQFSKWLEENGIKEELAEQITEAYKKQDFIVLGELASKVQKQVYETFKKRII